MAISSRGTPRAPMNVAMIVFESRGATRNGLSGIVGLRDQRRDEDHQQAVDLLVGQKKTCGRSILVRRRGRQHVDRIATFAAAGRNDAAPCAMPRSEWPAAAHAPSHASAARIAGPPALVKIGHARAGGQRLVRQQRRDVEELLQRVGSDDARLAKQRVDDRVARGQRAGVRRGGPSRRHAIGRI